jgi:hypothetical protein
MRPDLNFDLSDIPETPDELNEDLPLTIPEYHLNDDEVEGMFVDYSTRGPNDWVVSGPLGSHGGGPGRKFATMKEAWSWAKEKYGQRLKGRITEATLWSCNRWAFLIKG